MKIIIMFICAVISFLLFEFTAFWGILITLSYFRWSPFGYEPCGLQAIAWFLIGPALLICLAIRAVMRHYYKLPFPYLVMPIIIGLIFILMISRAGFMAWAITTSVSAGLVMIFTLFTDIWCFRKRKVSESKTEPAGEPVS